jgi:hypothetical protein
MMPKMFNIADVPDISILKFKLVSESLNSGPSNTSLDGLKCVLLIYFKAFLGQLPINVCKLLHSTAYILQ